MNIKNELAHLASDFKEAGILAKIFLLSGFFMSFSSIASLSKKVFEWKGFFLEAINFYQVVYVDNVVRLASLLGLHYSQSEVHVVTVLSIAVVVGMRTLAQSQIAIFNEINQKHGTDIEPKFTFLWIAAVATPLCTWVVYGIADPSFSPWSIALVTLGYPLFMFIPQILLVRFVYKSDSPSDYGYIKAYYQYILSILILVGILAAINLGLSQGI